MIGTRVAYDVLARSVGPLVAQHDPLQILMYHQVQSRPSGTYDVSVDLFRRQVAYLVDEGYRFLSMRELFESWPGVLNGPRSVVLTFDDLWASQIDQGLPIMKEHGCTGTFFVSTAYVGNRRQRPSQGPLAHSSSEIGCWEDVKTLEDSGMEIGAHTHTHPRMRDLSRAEIKKELATSNQALAAVLRVPITSFAIPYGEPSTYSSWMIPMLTEFGYKTACTTRWGRPTLNSRLLELPRMTIGNSDDLQRFRMKLRGQYDFLRWVRR